MNWALDVAYATTHFEVNVCCTGGPHPVALLGPNGSGKSTVLRLMCGILTPHRGAISVSNTVLFNSNTGLNLAPAERCIGYVPQGGGLFHHLDVLNNVAFGPRVRGISKSDARHSAAQQLDEMGISHLATRRAHELSGGEAQKVALARALVNRPMLLLLDEPLTALDIPTRRAYRTFLTEYLSREACAAIIVTHDIRDVLALDAHAVVLDNGSVQQAGTVKELSAHPASPFVDEFFSPLGTVHPLISTEISPNEQAARRGQTPTSTSE